MSDEPQTDSASQTKSFDDLLYLIIQTCVNEIHDGESFLIKGYIVIE